MQMRRSRFSKSQQDRLIEHFVAGTPARGAANLVGVNFTTAVYDYHRLRDILCVATGEDTPFTGEVELDESYFGGIRKGKRGRGAAGKVPVFGILKRGGKVYIRVIPDAKSKTFMPIIQEKIQPDSIVYTDCWRGYNVLELSGFKHSRINHSKLFAREKNHSMASCNGPPDSPKAKSDGNDRCFQHFEICKSK